MTTEYQYPGEELKLFEEAKNWKKYLASQVTPFIRGRVLEVGAGISETTPFLINKEVIQWTCLEPDQRLFSVIEQKINNNALPSFCEAQVGTITDLHSDQKFDTIVYIDVLEHIRNDRNEVVLAASHLNEGGHLVILSPAFQFLYNRFDKAVGHERRYTKKSLRSVFAGIKELSEEKLFYMESAGVALLLLNKLFFRKKYPSSLTIRLWDKLLIPVSRIAHKMIMHSVGKTIIGIWKYSKE